MKDESSCRSSSFDKLRDDHVSQDLIVVVVAKKVCLYGEIGPPPSVVMIGNATIVEPS